MNHLLLRKSVALTVIWSVLVHADPWTNVICTNPETAWTVNSLGQSACLVAATIGAVCADDGTWGVPSLDGTNFTYYVATGSHNCICNSVMWSLLSVCSLCQGRSSSPWAIYTNECTTADTSPPGVYPAPLPVGVAVPNWAYYDYVTAGMFNLAIAKQQTGPESTALPRPSNTASPTSTTMPINEPSSKSDTGAIVGGVVGGVLGIALFALIAFIVVHKSKRKKQEHNPPTLATTQFDATHAFCGQYQSGKQPLGSAPTSPFFKPNDPNSPSALSTGRPNGENVSDSVQTSYYQQNTNDHPPHPNLPQL